MDFFNDIFHNLALLEFYFLNIIYILLYIDFILSIFFQHSNILTRASHHWCLASNIVAITCGYGGYLLPLLAAHSSLLLAALLNIQLLKPGPNIYEFIIPIFYRYRLVVHGKIINQSEHNFTLSMKALQSRHGMCKILTYWVTVMKIRLQKSVDEIWIMSS